MNTLQEIKSEIKMLKLGYQNKKNVQGADRDWIQAPRAKVPQKGNLTALNNQIHSVMRRQADDRL